MKAKIKEAWDNLPEEEKDKWQEHANKPYMKMFYLADYAFEKIQSQGISRNLMEDIIEVHFSKEETKLYKRFLELFYRKHQQVSRNSKFK